MSSDTPIPDWHELEREEVQRCRVFHVDRHRMREDPVPGEDETREGDFFVMHAPDWINVVALTDADELILIEQWRHGVRRITLEIPGGMVDPDEDPETAARRELLEETGYTSREWHKLGAVEPNPAIQSNHCHTYLALGAQPTAAPHFDGHERCRVVVTPYSRIPSLLKEQKISHALVVAALSFEALRRAGHFMQSQQD